MSTDDTAAGRLARQILATVEEYERATIEGRATTEAKMWITDHSANVLDGTKLRCPYNCGWTMDGAKRPGLWLAAHLADQHPEE